MSLLQQVKMVIIEYTHLAKDALHIYVALAIMLGACFAFGWKVRQWRPWLLVLAVALAGEYWDWLENRSIGRTPDYDILGGRALEPSGVNQYVKQSR